MMDIKSDVMKEFLSQNDINLDNIEEVCSRFDKKLKTLGCEASDMEELLLEGGGDSSDFSSDNVEYICLTSFLSLLIEKNYFPNFISDSFDFDIDSWDNSVSIDLSGYEEEDIDYDKLVEALKVVKDKFDIDITIEGWN